MRVELTVVVAMAAGVLKLGAGVEEKLAAVKSAEDVVAPQALSIKLALLKDAAKGSMGTPARYCKSCRRWSWVGCVIAF